MSQATKRPRITRGAYVDKIDDLGDDSYEGISVLEGKLHKTGANTVHEPLPIREVLHDISGSWRNLTSWAVVDNSDLALDPVDGHLYIEALNREVMDDSHDATGNSGPQAMQNIYIRSRVSVSVLSTHYFR